MVSIHHMHTRRHRNKTKKNNRKRGGAALFRRASAFTRRMYNKLTCCRPGQHPDDTAAAAAGVVGPDSQPYIRRARVSRSPDASCVPCPRPPPPPTGSPTRSSASSRPLFRPLPPIPQESPQPPPPLTGPPSRPLPPTPRPIYQSPSRSSSSSSSRSRSRSSSSSSSSSRSRSRSRSSRSQSVSPTEVVSDILKVPVSSSVSPRRHFTLNRQIQKHMEIIQRVILTWQTIADTRRKYLSRLLTRFEEVDKRIQAKVGNTLEEALAYLYESRTTIMGNIKKTSEELLRCKTSIRFWTDASQGTAEVRYPTGSLSDDVVTRIFKHLPPPYITQLRNEITQLRKEIARLSDVDPSNLNVFRSL